MNMNNFLMGFLLADREKKRLEEKGIEVPKNFTSTQGLFFGAISNPHAASFVLQNEVQKRDAVINPTAQRRIDEEVVEKNRILVEKNQVLEEKNQVLLEKNQVLQNLSALEDEIVGIFNQMQGQTLPNSMQNFRTRIFNGDFPRLKGRIPNVVAPPQTAPTTPVSGNAPTEESPVS